MGRIRDENYYQVSGWMITKLGLKSYELQAFAIIYGFTQDGVSLYSGSLSYISEWLGASRPTTIKTLKSLVDKGYILKEQNTINGVSFNKYYANLTAVEAARGSKESLPPVKDVNRGSKEILLGGSKESLPGSKEILLGGSKKSLPNNNTRDNNKDNNRDNNNYNNDEQSKTVEVVVENPVIFWEQNVGLLTPYVADCLKDMLETYGEAVVMQAMEIAVKQGKRTPAYVEGCCKNIASGATPFNRYSGKGNRDLREVAAEVDEILARGGKKNDDKREFDPAVWGVWASQ